jgi:hypothetical protein
MESVKRDTYASRFLIISTNLHLGNYLLSISNRYVIYIESHYLVLYTYIKIFEVPDMLGIHKADSLAAARLGRR